MTNDEVEKIARAISDAFPPDREVIVSMTQRNAIVMARWILAALPVVRAAETWERSARYNVLPPKLEAVQVAVRALAGSDGK